MKLALAASAIALTVGTAPAWADDLDDCLNRAARMPTDAGVKVAAGVCNEQYKPPPQPIKIPHGDLLVNSDGKTMTNPDTSKTYEIDPQTGKPKSYP
ncbi:MAG: hypothetical protein J2P48_10030 [Alphaproteobacteria bacterium]|nr:hypothetical protein [Alphaproteobacteria bacterium]